MEVLADKLQIPLRKFRKSLKRMTDDASVEGVHTLRTRARKVEAISSALMQDHKGKTRSLLKAVKPVRKAAGQVRDMDVLIANVLSLAEDSSDDSHVRLVEHLGSVRFKGARRLSGLIDSQGKSTSRSLKQFAKKAGKWLERQDVASTGALTASVALATELSRWPRFTAKNIHPFRIKVKQLRYMLQLAPNPEPAFMEALDQVKSAVGEWHDWNELSAIAAKVLDAKTDHALLAEIREQTHEKLSGALAVANALRQKYLHGARRSGRGQSSGPPLHLFSSNGGGTKHAAA